MLRLLQGALKLRLWMVTRAVDGDQIVLEYEDDPRSGYAVQPGLVLPWDGSLCAEMVAGHGPAVAPRAADVPAYADAENRRHTPIEAYVGVPLRHPDGTLFGTLCGFDAARDDLTGLANLRAWGHIVAAEEARSRALRPPGIRTDHRSQRSQRSQRHPRARRR